MPERVEATVIAFLALVLLHYIVQTRCRLINVLSVNGESQTGRHFYLILRMWIDQT